MWEAKFFDELIMLTKKGFPVKNRDRAKSLLLWLMCVGKNLAVNLGFSKDRH
jgi:hypothetical protein